LRHLALRSLASARVPWFLSIVVEPLGFVVQSRFRNSVRNRERRSQLFFRRFLQ
jgi:hypothetical protein